MTVNACVSCGRPTPDGYADIRCCDRARGQLAEIADLASAARDKAYRLSASRSDGSGSGKPGSRLPLDLAAAAKLDALANALGSWVRHIAEERGVYPDRVAPGADVISASARFLADHCEWMRHRPEVDEFLTDVEACVRIVRQVADTRHDQQVIVGLCDCGKMLYAPKDRAIVICPECERQWDVDATTEALSEHLDERLVTAAEAAHLAGFLDTDRSGEQIRKLVNKWSSRGELSVDDTGEEPRYWFGNIAFRLANTPRRASVLVVT